MKAKELRKLLKTLEKDYGWSFYDEKGKLHLTDMQKSLISDVYHVAKNAPRMNTVIGEARKGESKVRGQ